MEKLPVFLLSLVTCKFALFFYHELTLCLMPANEFEASAAKNEVWL